MDSKSSLQSFHCTAPTSDSSEALFLAASRVLALLRLFVITYYCILTLLLLLHLIITVIPLGFRSTRKSALITFGRLGVEQTLSLLLRTRIAWSSTNSRQTLVHCFKFEIHHRLKEHLQEQLTTCFIRLYTRGNLKLMLNF